MDPNLTQLIGELFVAIHALSSYAIPDVYPPVYRVTLSEMQERVCRGPCQVRGFYVPEQGIFINEALDLERDVVARSVLLHELVHYAQDASGRFERLSTPCDRWYAKEHEAYNIQNAYLREQRQQMRFAMGAPPRMCYETPDDPPPER